MIHCNYNFECLKNVEMKGAIDDNLNTIFDSFDNEEYQCPYIRNFGELTKYTCPIRNYLMNPDYKNKLFKINVALVLSSDSEIRSKFSSLFQKIHINHIFESTITKTIIRILELDVKVVIIDIGENDYQGLFKLIRKIRPRLPIIAICQELSDDQYQQLQDVNINYVLVKPIRIGKLIDYISNIDQNPVYL